MTKEQVKKPEYRSIEIIHSEEREDLKNKWDLWKCIKNPRLFMSPEKISRKKLYKLYINISHKN